MRIGANREVTSPIAKFFTEEDKAGIHELPSDVEAGSDPIKALGMDDEVIDFELTSNRGDLLSMLGLAYECAAITGEDVKEPDIINYSLSSKKFLTDEDLLKLIKGEYELKIDKPLKNKGWLAN